MQSNLAKAVFQGTRNCEQAIRVIVMNNDQLSGSYHIAGYTIALYVHVTAQIAILNFHRKFFTLLPIPRDQHCEWSFGNHLQTVDEILVERTRSWKIRIWVVLMSRRIT